MALRCCPRVFIFFQLLEGPFLLIFEHLSKVNSQNINQIQENM